MKNLIPGTQAASPARDLFPLLEQVRGNFEALREKLERLPATQQAPLAGDFAQIEAGLRSLQQKAAEAEKYEAEATLQDAQNVAKLQAVMQVVSEGLIVADAQGNIQVFNEAKLELTGLEVAPDEPLHAYSQRMMMREPGGQLITEEQRPWTRALRGEQVRDAEFEVHRLDTGKTYTALYNASPVIDEHGKVQNIIITVRDITRRERAEKQLEIALHEVVTERNRLQAVMEAMPVGVAINDLQGGNTQANPMFEEIWGGPRPVTNTVSDYAAYIAWWVDSGNPVQPEEWASAQALQHGRTVTGQFVKIRRFDGTYRYVINSSAPTRDADGHITGSVVAIMDVTDRVQAEQALSLTNNQFRTLVENLSVGVVLTDAAGNFLITNEANQRLFGGQGVTGDASGPAGGYTLHHADGTPFAMDELPLVRSLKEGVSAKDVEMIVRRENGEEISILANSNPVHSADGAITGAVASMQDVTRLKQAEIQRRLMNFRENERQEIARDIHDGPIQNLTSTLFNIQFAKEAISDGSTRLEFEQIGASVQGVIRELREVCNALRPPSLIRFGVAKAIQVQAAEFCERHPGVNLALDLFQDKSHFSEQTALAIYRIYQEAMNNIARHSNASHVWVRFAFEDRHIVLEIHDDGVGFRVPSDMTRPTESGHFGIVGMKERADVIGAELEITSEPGHGATVRLRVPVTGE